MKATVRAGYLLDHYCKKCPMAKGKRLNDVKCSCFVQKEFETLREELRGDEDADE